MTEKEKKTVRVILTSNTPIPEKRMKGFITTADLDSSGKLMKGKVHAPTK